MSWYADLHLHSKYSRATSPDCDLEHLALWAQKKGLTVVGSGDLTHPAWRAELRDKLVPAEAGLYRLRPDLETAVAALVPAICRAPVRFLLSGEISTIYKKGERTLSGEISTIYKKGERTLSGEISTIYKKGERTLSGEISTIYKKGERTRKVHHVIYAPDLDTAERLAARLARIGNLVADGRPILGLDSRHLLEMVLESGPGAFLVPAHIWTPWFSMLGSRSGFDSVDECYGDLTPHIFALETGLSSDPEMNWRISALDRYRLVSNSDAHSPAKLGREATILEGPISYPSVHRALETGVGYVGTVEFFPEEGKYHLDGHRKCQVRLTPTETLALGGRCPVCGEPVIVGVTHRVGDLADRQQPLPPATAGIVRSLVPLVEILAELVGTGSNSKRVTAYAERLLAHFGPELHILTDLPIEDLTHAQEPLVAEALTRLRRGEVYREAGYDGEYGVIRMFQPNELSGRPGGRQFLAMAAAQPIAAVASAVMPRELVSTVRPLPYSNDPLAGLDADQRAAAEVGAGALLIVAGPGSGKTHTLTRRIAYLISQQGVAADTCLAVTFTRRAAAELRERLDALLPQARGRVLVHTFHSLGLAILRECSHAVGLEPDFRVIAEDERTALLRGALDLTVTQAQRLMRRISRAKATGALPVDPALATSLERHDALLRAHGGVDFDDLVGLAVTALETDLTHAHAWRERCAWISVDEYQDVDPRQHRLLCLLAPPGSNVCAIGDHNQAIYGFRGADVAIFQRFADDWSGAQVVHLTRNYRSGRLIVAAASQILTDAAIPTIIANPQRIITHAAVSERAEAQFVVRTLESLLGGQSFFALDSGHSDGRTTDLAFGDFAILARTDALFESVAEVLARAGLPFQRRSHAALGANPAVVTLMDAVAVDLDQHPSDQQLVVRLKNIAEDLALAAPERAQALRHAAELLAPLAVLHGADLIRNEWALLTEADTWDPRAERIALLTIHAAKGLEFRVVFIMGCEDGLLPLSWGAEAESEEAKTAQAEERRLFYVGITRARERLLLTYAQHRMWRGKIRECVPSPFLHDLKEDLLEHSRGNRDKFNQQQPSESTSQLNLF